LYAKLFFNTNKILETTDLTNAFYRRLIIISFPRTFEEKDQDPHLIEKLTSEEELSGIFNLLMVYLRLLVNNNGIYLDEKSISERRLKHERLTDPIKAFLDEAMAEDSQVDDYVPKGVLYNAYERFCRKYKLPIKSSIGFGKEITNMRTLISHKETKGERRTIWKGIRLTPEYQLSQMQATLFQ
jgi:putative DNA primase/helicase